MTQSVSSWCLGVDWYNYSVKQIVRNIQLFWSQVIYVPYQQHYHLQEIKRANEAKGTRSCKIALYRTFLKCGVKTWEQVIKALEECGHEETAEQVKVQLLKAYGTVTDVYNILIQIVSIEGYWSMIRLY